MSSRRGVGEDNILAMLERDCARRSGKRLSGVRLAWYGAGAALCGILVGGVAWLAYDNHQTGSQLQAQYEAAAVTGRPAEVANAPATPSPAPAPVTAPLAAVIVDEQPRMRTAPPPLVMLPPHEAAAAKPAPAAAAGQRTPDTAQAGPVEAPQRQAATPAVPRATPSIARAADKRVQKPARAKATGPKPSSRRPAKTAMRSASAAQARAHKAVPVTAGSETQPDGDVALISAIIAQSERHRGEHDEAASCPGGKCPPKATRR